MGNFIDLTGQTFGRLTVIERVENSKGGKTRWLCKCECGNEIIVQGSNLTSGHTKGCGCLHKEFEDLTGRKFSRLTVVKRVENSKGGKTRSLCLCECGNEVIVMGNHLTSGHTKSCGCLHKNAEDLTGQTFGRLTVIRRVNENSKSRQVRFLCKCFCGNEVIGYSYSLTHELTKSCGCYNREIVSKRMKKGYGESSFNGVINDYKKRAKKQGYEFSLSEDEFKELMLSPCEYCGEEPSNKRISIANNGDFQYNGIDRIDNTKGYVKSNVVTSCGRCNYGKHTASKDEFLSCIKAIYDHLDLSNTFSSSYELGSD